MAAQIVRKFALAGGIAVFGALMFFAGRQLGAASASAAPTAAPEALAKLGFRASTSVQNLPMQPEMIPFPAPDRQGPGQGLGQWQDCQPIILFYYQGRLYQLMPGPDNPPGMPGSPPEYFPLRPYQGPQIPGLPFGPAPQQLPGFQPLQPRF